MKLPEDMIHWSVDFPNFWSRKPVRGACQLMVPLPTISTIREAVTCEGCQQWLTEKYQLPPGFFQPPTDDKMSA